MKTKIYIYNLREMKDLQYAFMEPPIVLPSIILED